MIENSIPGKPRDHFRELEYQTFRPCVVVLSGAPLHGKTATANAIADRSNFRVFDVDEVRKKYFAAKSGILLSSDEETNVVIRSFKKLFEEMREAVKNGSPVVIPAGFSRTAYKEVLLQFAEKNPDLPLVVFQLDLPSSSEIEKRIGGRIAEKSPSNIRSVDQYRHILSVTDPWPSGIEVVPVSSNTKENNVEQIFERLKRMNLIATL